MFFGDTWSIVSCFLLTLTKLRDSSEVQTGRHLLAPRNQFLSQVGLFNNMTRPWGPAYLGMILLMKEIIGAYCFRS